MDRNNSNNRLVALAIGGKQIAIEVPILIGMAGAISKRICHDWPRNNCHGRGRN